MKTIVSILAIIFVVSCENFYDDDEEYIESIAIVESLHVDTVVNKTATVTLTCPTPTPCWNFSRVEEKRVSNNIHLTLYRKVKKNITCVQVTGSFKHTMDINVPTSGAYTIKIYQTLTTTMDTTIVF
ncbi:MAG: hypothetical protein WCX28_13445 [Bacteriovoracaceae bacterium]|nr:hypothetical protein [Bacteroidota bacterium]